MGTVPMCRCADVPMYVYSVFVVRMVCKFGTKIVDYHILFIDCLYQ